jgi:hypothetical protein
MKTQPRQSIVSLNHVHNEVDETELSFLNSDSYTLGVNSKKDS